MKKTSKIVAVVLTALLVVAAVVVLASCAKTYDDVAYGLVHGEGYVAKATVTKDADGKVKDATLDEACFPTQVTATEADGDYTVTVGTKHYYKTVKWAKVTAVWDADKGEYTVDGVSLRLFFKIDEGRCEEYFEAVSANAITVVTSSGNKTDIMTAETLLKSKNGYWGNPSANALGWKANVEATINYVKANGFGLKKSNFETKDNSASNAKLDNEWVEKSSGVATGATWTDFYDYYCLLERAFLR